MSTLFTTKVKGCVRFLQLFRLIKIIFRKVPNWRLWVVSKSNVGHISGFAICCFHMFHIPRLLLDQVPNIWDGNVSPDFDDSKEDYVQKQQRRR